MSLRRKIFYGFTLAVVAVLLLLPATSWLARLQLLPFTLPAVTPLLFGNNKSGQNQYEKQVTEAVAKSGNDFTLQYAYASAYGFDDKDAKESLRRQEKLNEDFPQNPVVITAMLKSMTRQAVKMRREEENLLSAPDKRTAKPYTKEDQSDPAELAKFIALAEAGEKLEPQNAYFAVLTAWGYFAAKQDDKAVAAWIRAGEKTEWNDHTTEEIIAKWKLQRTVNSDSETGAIARMGSMAGISFPQYGGMRASARMAAVMAMQAELRGDKETGFTIRRASRQIGQNMQERSKNYIGNLVGRAIVSLAMSRAGGEEPRENPYKGDTERWMRERQDRYADYMRSIGHPEEAVAFTAAIKNGDFLKTLFTRTSPKTYWGFEAKTYQLFGAWCANFLLIAGVLFSLAFAGIFKLVYKFSPRLQKGGTLQKSAKWGITVGLMLPFIAGAITLSAIGLWLEPDQAVMIGFVVGIMALAVPPFLLRFSRREFGHGLLVMLTTWGSLVALIAAGMGCTLFAQGMTGALGLLTSGSSEDGALDVMKVITPWAIGAMVLSVPMGLLLLFGVFSKILKVPFAAGVTRGMRAIAVPLACVLTLLWSGALMFTLRHERAAITEMEQMATMGEMQYLKQIDSNPAVK